MCKLWAATCRSTVTPPRLHARRRRASSGTHVPLVPLWKAGRLSAPPGLASVPAPLPSAAEVGLPEDEEHRTEHGRRATQRQHQGAQRPRRHRGGRGAQVRVAQAEPAGLKKMAPLRLPRPRPPTQPTQPRTTSPTMHRRCRDRRRELGAQPGEPGPPAHSARCGVEREAVPRQDKTWLHWHLASTYC